MSGGDMVVEYSGAETRVADLPSTSLRASFGYGHFPGHNRSVVVVPGRTWPHTPETCSTDDYVEGEWLDEQTLVCRGCGLDCT